MKIACNFMLVLGIESSCDETAAAVVADGERIRSSVVASQVLTHEKYGGVVPELASREHLRAIEPVVDEACRQAEVTLRNVDAIAVTEGPGLIGSLLVGLVYGKALALALNKPLVGVNHLEGHIHAVLLENKMDRAAGRPLPEARLPAVTLVVSGGHTTLFHVTPGSPSAEPSSPRFHYTQLGHTRDDAAGEAFDKVSKLLALGYPGGPVIDKLSRFGDPDAVDFGHIKMKGNPLDFSFSGLKTAALYRVRGTDLAREAEERRAWRNTVERPTLDDLRGHCSQATIDLIASFQHAVVQDLVERTLAAAEDSRVDNIFISGGVACNSLLRQRFTDRSRGFHVFFPSPALSTDNAAMIAAAGYYKLLAGERAGVSLTAHASFPLGANSQ
ncbi:MAG TPA: tRNA (adenosine(37)-N6)-threonylcarbamoyltransferase complex transferase subunit TsaD [Terriglobia bacterium]|nr:tRNA (adenosine(37)-N6)-threonylcarbamoyltransferase complex transferase subunit TsaD [Terriglobia bacterium]